MESTLAGVARCLFSATRAAAVTCGIMKPEFRPGCGVRKAGRRDKRRVHQHGDAAFGQRADLAQRQRDHVGGEGDRFAVEIAAGQRLGGVGQNQRVVGHAVGLDRQRGGGLAQQVEHGAHDLRLAAQAVGVLHAVVADAGGTRGWRCRRSGHATPRRPRSGRDGRAVPGCADRKACRSRGRRRSKGSRDQRGLQQALGFEQAGERIGSRELHAVQQRQAFFRPQGDRLQTGRDQRGSVRRCADRRAPLRPCRSWRRPCGRAAPDRRTRRRSLARG